MRVQGKDFRTVWMDGGAVQLINQPLLPHRFEIASMPDHRATAAAIRDMIVRGAPAIGATPAFGLAQVYAEAAAEKDRETYIAMGFELLRATRPTAQNLFHALDRIRAAAQAVVPSEQAAAARRAAEQFADEEAEASHKIGKYGSG